VSSAAREEFQRKYKEGKYAFERGQYRLSIEQLEAAIKLVGNHSRLGGEAQMWLVNAYQAAGRQQEALALCQQLTTHPHSEIRRQSKDLLYIIKAPRLKRPKEWMSEIPDLNSLSESPAQYRGGSGKSKIKPKPQIETIDLSQVNTKDNRFIWLGLLLTIMTLAGLFWFS
jgi:tetratricopeptide (TPR) repeat protein